MTERTIRMMAKDLAGVYYDQERSERFRKLNPSQQAYVNRMWPHFVDLAIKSLVEVLKQKNVSQPIKDGIMAALVEQNQKAQAHTALLVPQATMDPVEREDRRLIDDNPQLLNSTTV